MAKELVKLGAEVWGVSKTKANLDSLQVRVGMLGLSLGTLVCCMNRILRVYL